MIEQALRDDSIGRIRAAERLDLHSLTLTVCRGDAEDALADHLLAVARQVADVAPGRIRRCEVAPSEDASLPVPCLVVGNEHQSNMRFAAAVVGHEETPFVEALVGLLGAAAPAAPWLDELTAGVIPAHLRVFVAAACPHCPRAVSTAVRLALAEPDVQLTVVDAQHHQDLASRFRARSVPLCVLDDGLTWTGVIGGRELVDKLLNRGTPQQQRELMHCLVESGRFGEAADRILTVEGRAWLAEAWSRSSTALRMGLMLAAEQALGKDPEGLDDAVPLLLPVLASTHPALRGDTVDLLGQIGHGAARSAIAALTSDEHEDVADAARSALAAIDARG